MKPTRRAPSIQITPKWESKVCKSYLLWASWSLTVHPPARLASLAAVAADAQSVGPWGKGYGLPGDWLLSGSSGLLHIGKSAFFLV